MPENTEMGSAASGPDSGPNQESYIEMPGGRIVPVKVHRCLWSGAHLENSLPAVLECYRERVARAEIDLKPLADGDFLLLHDMWLDSSTTGTGLVGEMTRGEAETLRLRVGSLGGSLGDAVSAERPPFFSEVLDATREFTSDPRSPTLLELDLGTLYPLTWRQAEELARMVHPLRDRVFINGYDWNMRRLLAVDPQLPVSYDLLPHLDWLPEGDPLGMILGLPRGAYGYLDAYPLARARLLPVAEYLTDRLDVLSRLVPGAREVHIHLETFEHMLDDGVAATDLFHRAGLRCDIWTLDAETPLWRERLARILAAGADVITSNTPRALALASREQPGTV